MRGVRRTGWGGGIGAGGPLIVALLFAIPEGVRSQGLSIQLSPSDHNGYAISCFGGRDGHIDLTVSGGSPPYTYEWSTGASTQDISGLAAGYYRVAVYDNNGGSAQGEITLGEPEQLMGTATAFEYPNDFHVSCHSCYNGSIDAGAVGGVAPYTYEWKDGPTVEDRSGLGARDYSVVVRDANGCEAEQVTLILREPQRNDWTMNGNAGTDPASQYVGTSDSKDLVFRTNGLERIRLMANGEVKLNVPGMGAGPLYRDADGILRAGSLPVALPLPATPCALTLGSYPLVDQHWRIDGNVFLFPQCDPELMPRIGTRTPNPISFITNDETRMVLTGEGKLGIGTVPPSGPIDQYRLFVEDGIATRDVLVKQGVWPDHVFHEGYRLMPLEDLRQWLREHHHLPGIPSAAEVEEKGGVEVGDLQRRMLETIEQQALYILQLEERLARVEQRIGTRPTSK